MTDKWQDEDEDWARVSISRFCFARLIDTSKFASFKINQYFGVFLLELLDFQVGSWTIKIYFW